jgi:ppGpp synthetase/RelA/SpoT-type nucleotidyltranferase
MALGSSGYENFHLLEMSVAKKEESLCAEIVIRTL